MINKLNSILPPFWLLGAVGLQLALHFSFPGYLLVTATGFVSGVGLIVLGLVLIIWSAGLFKRAGTPMRPFHDVKVIVIEGPYRISRNPMYLGMLLMLAGAAIGLGSLAALLIVPLFFLLIRNLFVIPEEEFMLGRFGESYQDYCVRVRRWI